MLRLYERNRACRAAKLERTVQVPGIVFVDDAQFYIWELPT
jgi:hypothetical protein